METQHMFDSYHPDGYDRLTKDDINGYAAKDQVNDLERRFIGEVRNHYDDIRNVDGNDGHLWMNADDITRSDVQKGLTQQSAFHHLFERDLNGKSLMERLAPDADGHIEPGKINDWLDSGRDGNGNPLSEEDKRSLELLNNNKSFWESLPFTNDQNKEDIERLAKQNGTNLDELNKLAPGTRPLDDPNLAESPYKAPPPVQAEEQKLQKIANQDADKQALKDKEAKDKETRQKDSTAEHDRELAKDLTIRKGEGYWDVAKRILKRTGHDDSTEKETWNLVRQLQRENRHARELHVGQQLKLNPEYLKRFDEELD
jgi:hypothetical protein